MIQNRIVKVLMILPEKEDEQAADVRTLIDEKSEDIKSEQEEARREIGV